AHLDKATGVMVHAIGSDKFPAPQGTLMATLIKGLLAHNLDWQYVLAGAFLSVTIELCGVNALSFAVGAYLPLSTTLPIWVGGVIKGVVDKRKGNAADSELGNGSLFSTGLVAGGALGGVLVAMLVAFATKLKDGGSPAMDAFIAKLNLTDKLTASLGQGGYEMLGVAFFALMGFVLYRIAMRPEEADLGH
ncbi:MAG TPA: OPT/YSL family transporter, partial [Holophagaceae bacterium]|nr:OPT/YSL family transporter [Holophagaceae bacterium]